MIEDVIQISQKREPSRQSEDDSVVDTDKLANITELFQSIELRLANLEMAMQTRPAETVHVNRIGTTPELWTLNVMKGLEIHLNDKPVEKTFDNKVVDILECVEEEAVEEEEAEEEVEEVEEEVEEAEEEVEEEEAEEEVEEEEEEEEVEEEEEEEEAEEEVEEEEEEEEAEEEEAEEEEEGLEVEEIIYKDRTYYRDSSNQIYAHPLPANAEPVPIGTWDVVRQRVLFKRI
jgi:flagellar biosynthesis GTPase FlhF